MAKFCRKCGFPVEDNMTFCPKCGALTDSANGSEGNDSRDERQYAPQPIFYGAPAPVGEDPIKEWKAKDPNAKSTSTGLMVGYIVSEVLAVICVIVYAVFTVMAAVTSYLPAVYAFYPTLIMCCVFYGVAYILNAVRIFHLVFGYAKWIKTNGIDVSQNPSVRSTMQTIAATGKIKMSKWGVNINNYIAIYAATANKNPKFFSRMLALVICEGILGMIAVTFVYIALFGIWLYFDFVYTTEMIKYLVYFGISVVAIIVYGVLQAVDFIQHRDMTVEWVREELSGNPRQ